MFQRKFVMQLCLLISFLLFLVPTVSAASVTLSGTITAANSDKDISSLAFFGYPGCSSKTYAVPINSRQHTFYVTKTGIYTLSTSNISDTWATAVIFEASYGNCLNGVTATGSPLSVPVTLKVGKTYIINIWVCSDSGCIDSEGDYTATISGPGEICIDSKCDNSRSEDITYPPDERINWQYGDLGAVLYRTTNSDSNWVIDTYCYDGSNAWLGMRTDASTASGTSANGCNVTFYIGADGVYQFNITFDGKLYEIRCQDFACNNPQMSYYDPNE